MYCINIILANANGNCCINHTSSELMKVGVKCTKICHPFVGFHVV